MVNGVQGKRPQPLARRGQGRHRPVVAFSPVPAKRLWLVYSLLAAGLAGLAIRLAWVQVIQGRELLERARAVQTQTVSPICTRRPIVEPQGRLGARGVDGFPLRAHLPALPIPCTQPVHFRPPPYRAIHSRSVHA